MAITFVQSWGNSIGVGNQSSIAAAFQSNNTAGNLLTLFIGANTPALIITVTDTLGNNWIPLTRQGGSIGTCQIFYVVNCKAGANTVTASFTGGNFPLMAIHEYFGADHIAPLDQQSGATAVSNASVSVGPVTTGAGNELIFGGVYASTSLSSVGSGFTQRESARINNQCTEDKILTAAGSVSLTMTLSGTPDWVANMATFQAAPSSFVEQSTGGTSVTLVNAAANGETLIAYIAAFRGAGVRTVSSIATTNVTWSKLAGTTNGGMDVEIWRGACTGATGTAVTLTMSGTGSTVVTNIARFIGISSTLDGAAATNTGTSTAPTTGALSTISTYDLILACEGHANGTVPSVEPGGNYETLQFVGSSTVVGVQGNFLSGADTISNATGAQSASWTITSAVWVTCIVALQLTLNLLPPYFEPRPQMVPLLVQ